MAASEQRTLLIDCDPQANSTSALGFPKDPGRKTLYHAMMLGDPLDSVVIRTQVDGLDIIPSDKNLVGAPVELVPMEGREYRLKGIAQVLRTQYEFVIIDCPPSLDLLTLNALAASDSVLVPIQCEYLALEGVSELLDTLQRLRLEINPTLEIEGILLTMFDDRTILSKQVAADLRSYFGPQVFESVIPRNVRLAEAPSHGKPVIFYDIHSKGAESYIQLSKEVISNAQKRLGEGTERSDPGSGTEVQSSDTTSDSPSAAAAAAGSLSGNIGSGGSGEAGPQ